MVKKLDTDKARQAKPVKGMRYVLVISTIGAVIALAIVYVVVL